jgi:hypothetical protein
MKFACRASSATVARSSRQPPPSRPIPTRLRSTTSTKALAPQSAIRQAHRVVPVMAPCASADHPPVLPGQKIPPGSVRAHHRPHQHLRQHRVRQRCHRNHRSPQSLLSSRTSRYPQIHPLYQRHQQVQRLPQHPFPFPRQRCRLPERLHPRQRLAPLYRHLPIHPTGCLSLRSPGWRWLASGWRSCVEGKTALIQMFIQSARGFIGW